MPTTEPPAQAVATERERIDWVDQRKRAGLCYCLACWQRENGSGTDGSTERCEGAYRSRTGGRFRNERLNHAESRA